MSLDDRFNWLATMIYRSTARTHVGLVRQMNQDAYLSDPDRGIFLVADGMGGEQAGEEASAQVVETVRAAVDHFFREPPRRPVQIRRLLQESVIQANQDVLQIAQRAPEKRGLGSTASLLCLHRGMFFLAQAGDSRIYLMREGRLRQLTRDHTVVWRLYEQGLLDREELETHPDRHLLTQCIGGLNPLHVDLDHDRLREDDCFLLCSDGLTGYVDEETISEVLQDPTLDIDGRAEKLLAMALAGGGGDNVTVLLIEVGSLEGEEPFEAGANGEVRIEELSAAATSVDEDTEDFEHDDSTTRKTPDDAPGPDYEDDDADESTVRDAPGLPRPAGPAEEETH